MFAVEGATTALGSSLDVFGVMMLSSPTALSRGIMRDLLIGAQPREVRALSLGAGTDAVFCVAPTTAFSYRVQR